MGNAFGVGYNHDIRKPDHRVYPAVYRKHDYRQLPHGRWHHLYRHVITATEPVTINASGNGMALVEGTAPSGVASSDILYPDSTAHRLRMNNNNGGAVTVSGLVASGTITVATGAIASGACATTTTTVSGVATTDAIAWNANGSLKAVTGYVPSTAGGLTLAVYPTSGNIIVDNCNWTTNSITPGAVTLNYTVTR